MMRNFKNNYKRNRYRSNGDRNYKRNGSHYKLGGDFSNGSDFKRRNPGRNNQNASQLIEKYNELAREALSNGDKILSENYFQHADHFVRISEKQINVKVDDINLDNENNKEILKEENSVETGTTELTKIKATE